MKTLIKVCFASLVLVVGLKLAGMAVEPGSNELTPGGVQYTTLTSSAVVFTNGGTVYGVNMSSGDNANYCVLFDTVAYVPVGGNNFAPFNNSTQTVTPFMIFYTTPTVGVGTTNSQLFSPYGIQIKNGLYFWKATGSFGQATIQWHK